MENNPIQNTETLTLHVGTYCLKQGMATIPRISSNLYNLQRIFVVKNSAVDKNKSYCTKTIMSTDRWGHTHTTN